jgi:AcrR family transcriptional regulator
MTLPRSGPVRSEPARRAILAATAELLAERGYDHLSIEGIAARAGVGKQTIYRWWPSKAAVVAEATLDGVVPGAQFTLPDSGNLRHDLEHWVRALVERISATDGAAQIRALSAAVATDAVASASLFEHLTGPELRAIVRRLETARQNGQVRADANLPAAADALLGFVAFIVLTGEPIAVDRGLALLDLVLRGVEPAAQ